MSTFLSRRLPRPRTLLTVCITAAIVGGLSVGILWRRSARGLASDLHGWISGRAELDLKTRPDLDRFAFDRSIHEFSRTAFVEAAVNDPLSPDHAVRRGLEAAVHSSGYTYPVNIVFAGGEGDDPIAPFYYVAELHGSIRYATRAGEVRLYADGLLDFPPAEMAISDEFGLSGLARVPGTADLIVTHPVSDGGKGFLNAVTRLASADGGRTVARRERILLLEGEPACPSNQIQQAVIGPDGKLWVSVGDAMNYSLAKDLERWGGKILRMNLDGSPCEDNPFRDPSKPRSPRSYAWAIGLRNSFDFVLDPGVGREPAIWAGDVGETLNRIVLASRGSDHGWDGTPESFCRGAAYLFQDRFIPAGMTFVDPAVMGAEFEGALWVAGYSYYFGRDPGASKRIISFQRRGGSLARGPVGIAGYKGEGQSTFLGLKQGPDGVYFTDFFGEQRNGKADGMGRVFRVAPSARTRELPADDRPPEWARWSAERRGKHIFVRVAGCGSCHTVERLSGGREGPVLDDIARTLAARLESPAYVDAARALAAGSGPEARGAIEEVLGAAGDDKLRRWLRHHIRNPRFDNPKGKMPAFSGLSEEDLGYLVELLVGLR